MTVVWEMSVREVLWLEGKVCGETRKEGKGEHGMHWPPDIVGKQKESLFTGLHSMSVSKESRCSRMELVFAPHVRLNHKGW